MRVLILGFVALLAACKADSDAHQVQDALQVEKVSYGIGYRVGSDMRQGEMDVDRDTLVQGIEDALAGKASRFAPQEIQAAVSAYRQRRHQARLELAQANEAAGRRFLTDYKKQPDVTEIPSGIAYRIINEGTGNRPEPGDAVRVHYRGRLINGDEFDTSHERGGPTILRVDQMIPGWREVLPQMHEGAKWEVVIPPRLAYGQRGLPPTIGPNEALIFELDLIDIVKSQVEAPAAKTSVGNK